MKTKLQLPIIKLKTLWYYMIIFNMTFPRLEALIMILIGL